MQFPLALDDVDSRGFTRVLAVLAVSLMLSNWLYFAAGGQTLGLATLASGGIIIWPALLALVYRQSRRGAIAIEANGLVVRRSFGSRIRMDWGDIEAVHTAALKDRGAYARLKAKISGVDPARKVVEIRLRRRLGPTLIPTVWAAGARSGLRSLTLDIRSPDEFVRATSGRIG